MTIPPFQAAVKHNPPDEQRRAAIETLTAKGRTAKLAVLVRTRSLPGGLRRQALDGLAACNATDELDTIAEDGSLPPELRWKAAGQ